MENVEYKDSYTIGTPSKEGAVKVYFDLKSMDSNDVMALVKRAKQLYTYSINAR